MLGHQRADAERVLRAVDGVNVGEPVGVEVGGAPRVDIGPVGLPRAHAGGVLQLVKGREGGVGFFRGGCMLKLVEVDIY